jgi:hypothetical protein
MYKKQKSKKKYKIKNPKKNNKNKNKKSSLPSLNLEKRQLNRRTTLKDVMIPEEEEDPWRK